jgi:hypothetical protein
MKPVPKFISLLLHYIKHVKPTLMSSMSLFNLGDYQFVDLGIL